MADWRQIQARIRKAKAADDAPTQLTELFERTRDAMVAFELAQCQEKVGDNAEATRWYTCAAERFRRAQWRTKAEEALTRLGAPIPVYTAEALIQPKAPPKSRESKTAARTPAKPDTVASDPAGTSDPEAPEPDSQQDFPSLAAKPQHPNAELSEPEPAEGTEESASGTPAASSTTEPTKKRRRRGRRGGRKRRPAGVEALSASPSGSPSANRNLGNKASSPMGSSSVELSAASPAGQSSANVSKVREMSLSPRPAPERRPLESEPATEAAPPPHQPVQEPSAPSWQGRTRAGEPAIASRISQLESQLRRLLACPLASLSEADQAPAGPGVLLLSDSDQVTHYYIESCQTLRIGIGNLLRGGRGSKDGGLLKERMAENLGIAEARVSSYLKDHCAVRWLQLDEGAYDLAHFAIAVLRPVVNE